MDIQWSEFRLAPTAYLQSRKFNVSSLVTSMIQIVASEQEKDEQLKVTILGVWQESGHMLFKDADRLENALSMLTDVFKKQRNTAGAFFLGQVLCTITSLLIQMEQHFACHDMRLVEFVVLLFDIVEKVKSETNLLLKSLACDCLTELEMSFPGLLASKVGHFFGMSQAENSYVHQHYTMLFATVLEHAVQKFILQQSENSSPMIQETLTDLLSYSDPLKSFTLPETFKEHAATILKKPPSSCSLGAETFNEVKKGMLSIIENSYLLTPACLATVTLRLISIVESSVSLSPKILKQLLRYSSSHNIQLFHLVLLLRVKFGEEICDEGDSEDIDKWQLVLAGQPMLSDEQRCLVWSWMLEWPNKDQPSVGIDRGSPVSEGEEGESSVQSADREMKERVLLPTVFDSLEIFLYKCKALFVEDHHTSYTNSFLPKSISDIVTNVLKQVQHDVDGPPAVTLYRVLFAYYMTYNGHDSLRGKEVEKLIFDITLQHPQLIPHTIDFISSVHKACPESPLPLNLLSEITQYLITVDLTQILTFLPLHLKFIRHAATNKHISPVVLLQLLLRVLKESSLCESGSWDIGNTLLDICNTVMQLHHTEVIFEDLSNLLQLIAEHYSDLDIQDRARFYHQLLFTVSVGKLSAILSLASDTTTGSSLAAIVEARISDNAFSSAPAVQVLDVSETGSFLSLQRVEGKQIDQRYSEEQSSNADGDLEEYLHQIDSDGQVVKKNPVNLQYRISYDNKAKGVSQRIFALVLKLRTNGPYHSSPDIFIPHLTASNKGTSSSVSSSIVTLSFFPKEPIPASFNVSVIFSTEDGISYSVSLDPIKLEFSDLFQHVSIPPMMSAEGLFSMLWTNIGTTEQKPFDMERQGVLSTVHLDMDKEDWEFSCRDLHSFEVPYNTTDSRGEHRVMIFLPPRFHLLLKFHLLEDTSNVLIATDSWEVLPLVQMYLQLLKAS